MQLTLPDWRTEQRRGWYMPLQSEQRLCAFLAVKHRHNMDIYVVKE
jgi:hypothetical protein